MMGWRAVFLIGVCAILIASYSVLTNDQDNGDLQSAAPAQPGYYVKDATIIDTNDAGVPYLQLSAGTIEQNPADNSIALQDVKLDYLSAPGRPWLLTAARGYIPPDSRIAEFSGNVVIEPRGGQANPVTLRTESLRIDTENSTADTRTAVTIEMNQQRLQAQGLTADLKQERLRLESKVNGRFQFK